MAAGGPRPPERPQAQEEDGDPPGATFVAVDGGQTRQSEAAEAVLEAVASWARAGGLDLDDPRNRRAAGDVASDLAARGITEPDPRDVFEVCRHLQDDAFQLSLDLLLRSTSYAKLADAVRDGSGGATPLHVVE